MGDSQRVSRLLAPTGGSFENLLIYLNTASGPLQNTAVRQAIADAIDYQGIVTALKGAALRQPGIIPTGLFGHSATVPLHQTNTDKAKQLLAGAGFGPGKQKITLNVTYTQGDSNEQLISTLMTSNLAPLNIDLNVTALTTSTKYAKARSTTRLTGRTSRSSTGTRTTRIRRRGSSACCTRRTRRASTSPTTRTRRLTSRSTASSASPRRTRHRQRRSTTRWR